ncbi:hypothetical protein FKM82_000929 [Ascaphus truei]
MPWIIKIEIQRRNTECMSNIPVYSTLITAKAVASIFKKNMETLKKKCIIKVWRFSVLSYIMSKCEKKWCSNTVQVCALPVVLFIMSLKQRLMHCIHP